MFKAISQQWANFCDLQVLQQACDLIVADVNGVDRRMEDWQVLQGKDGKKLGDQEEADLRAFQEYQNRIKAEIDKRIGYIRDQIHDRVSAMVYPAGHVINNDWKIAVDQQKVGFSYSHNRKKFSPALEARCQAETIYLKEALRNGDVDAIRSFMKYSVLIAGAIVQFDKDLVEVGKDDLHNLLPRISTTGRDYFRRSDIVKIVARQNSRLSREEVLNGLNRSAWKTAAKIFEDINSERKRRGVKELSQRWSWGKFEGILNDLIADDEVEMKFGMSLTEDDKKLMSENPSDGERFFRRCDEVKGGNRSGDDESWLAKILGLRAA